MKTEKDNYPGLKKALEIRTGNGLPSNFNYRMMDRIRLEAERQKKRRRLISWLSLIVASVSLIGFGAYVLIVYLEFNIMHHLPQMEKTQSTGELISFYWYIASLILVLLGLDYCVRRYRRKTTQE